jgi:hypothetical protein
MNLNDVLAETMNIVKATGLVNLLFFFLGFSIVIATARAIRLLAMGIDVRPITEANHSSTAYSTTQEQSDESETGEWSGLTCDYCGAPMGGNSSICDYCGRRN